MADSRGAIAAQPYRLPVAAAPKEQRFLLIAFRAIVVLTLVIAAGGASLVPKGKVSAQNEVWTTTSDLNLRSDPWIGADILAVIPYGGRVEVTGDQQNGFFGVSFNGASGYAYGDYLYRGSRESADEGATVGASGAATTTSALNLRADASTASDVLTVMPEGASVTLLGTDQNGFSQVSYGGQQGWAYADYLSTGGSQQLSGWSGDTSTDSGTTGSAPSGEVWATSALNLRSGASTSYSVLTVIPVGASANSLGTSQNGFWQVNYNGTQGWASADYLTSDGSAYNEPAPTGNTSNTGTTDASSDSVVDIIYAAADRYGQPRADMLRVAQCESNLDPNAVNAPGGSYGLFQFKPGTWASTPYASYDIFDAWASANAAAWMWSVGRRNEWVCQ